MLCHFYVRWTTSLVCDKLLGCVLIRPLGIQTACKGICTQTVTHTVQIGFNVIRVV